MNYKMPNRDKRAKSDRGFVIYDQFEDRYDSNIILQESSIAFEPCIWIFAKNSSFKDSEPSPHLTPLMAARVIKALQQFIEDSALEDPVEED